MRIPLDEEDVDVTGDGSREPSVDPSSSGGLSRPTSESKSNSSDETPQGDDANPKLPAFKRPRAGEAAAGRGASGPQSCFRYFVVVPKFSSFPKCTVAVPVSPHTQHGTGVSDLRARGASIFVVIALTPRLKNSFS